MVGGVDVRDRYVMVPATALEDLCALALRASDDIELRFGHDPLVVSLRGAIAEVRAHSILDPVS